MAGPIELPDPARHSPPDQVDPWREAHLQRLLDSYLRLTGNPLLAIDPQHPLTPQLWQAPLVVVSHGTEPDPVLNYGNRLALQRWKLPWQQFVVTPSRQTAETGLQQARAELMRQVTERGFIQDYSGIRIAADGQRFRMLGATVWNICDAAGVYHGQAACFARWEDLPPARLEMT